MSSNAFALAFMLIIRLSNTSVIR